MFAELDRDIEVRTPPVRQDVSLTLWGTWSVDNTSTATPAWSRPPYSHNNDPHQDHHSHSQRNDADSSAVQGADYISKEKARLEKMMSGGNIHSSKVSGPRSCMPTPLYPVMCAPFQRICALSQ